MVVELTIESILVFLVFIAFIFVSYKLFKFFVRASLVSIAGFVFPWVASYMGVPIVANLETAITFSFIGLFLFLIYESYHFIVHFFKMLAWPLKKRKKVKR
ncbi:MAG: hypothetical protein V1818_01265 [Candidatus Aenigmatarchaeota archaeon]